MNQMLPRVIPQLLLFDGGMVKTTRFQKPVYVGDPVNVINLFNQFEVDEIALLDIRASVEKREPDIDLIEHLAAECWVPLAYGGGITTLEQIAAIMQKGVEKVVLNSCLADHLPLLSEAAKTFGSQAIVAGMDVAKSWFLGWDVYVRSGKERLHVQLEEYAKHLEHLGAGEILLNCIDQEGTMKGFNEQVIARVSNAVTIPVIASGGASCRQDLCIPIKNGASAVSAGSIFVFKGAEKGVLVNFPERKQLECILSQ